MNPALAYGRHRGPSASGSRIAAVALALYQDERGQWTLPLTLRPDSLTHHGGQICLPGGRVEEGESVDEAAIREFEEELGLPVEIHERCGELSAQYVYASNNLVHPVVLVVDRPRRHWIPDPVEVAEVITMPLDLLADRQSRVAVTTTRKVQGPGGIVGTLSLRTPAFRYQGHHIWGVTAMILDELAQILHSSPDPAPG